MNDLANRVSALKLKVEKLVNLHDSLNKENRELINRKEALNLQIEDLIQQNKDLKESNKLIKLAQAVTESDQNTRDVKIKINEYVREIDKCIALINR
jgi:hypothetical protein